MRIQEKKKREQKIRHTKNLQKRKRKMVAGEYNCFPILVIICFLNANTKSKLMTLGLYFLQSAGVQFAQRDQVVQPNNPISQPSRTTNVPNREQASPRHEANAQLVESRTVPKFLLLIQNVKIGSIYT